MRKTAALFALVSQVLACTGTTASTIPAREITALNADRKRVHSVWTTEGNVVDVAEPYALELRTKEGTANEQSLPDAIEFQGPVLAARTDTNLVVQECARLSDETCRPSAPEVVLPISSIESVSVHTREQPSDRRSGPSSRGPWIAAVVFGSLLGAAAIAAVIVSTERGVWGGPRR